MTKKHLNENLCISEININLIGDENQDVNSNSNLFGKVIDKSFKKFELLLKKYLYSTTFNSNSVNLSMLDSNINSKINTLIEENLEKQIPKPSRLKQIIAIGGLSESGKSSTGRLLLEKYNIPNFKFNYINNVVKKTYGILEEENLFKNDVKTIAILVINEILSLLKTMYYWDFISFESLHDFGLTEKMKNVIPGNFNIVFLKTSKENRINRNIKDVGSLDCSKKEIEKKIKLKLAVELQKLKVLQIM